MFHGKKSVLVDSEFVKTCYELFIRSLLTAEYASKDPAFVVLLTFVTGLIIMLLGFLRLGK